MIPKECTRLAEVDFPIGRVSGFALLRLRSRYKPRRSRRTVTVCLKDTRYAQATALKTDNRCSSQET